MAYPEKVAKVCVRPAALELGIQLFGSEFQKDVHLKGSDGTVLAHSAVLGAVSEVFKAMLSSEMREAQEKAVEIHDMTCTQLRFFLRLLYTLQIEEEDWSSEKVEDAWFEVKINSDDLRNACDDEDFDPDEANGLYAFASNVDGSPIFQNVNPKKHGLLYHCPASHERNNIICPDLISGPSWKISSGWYECWEAEKKMSRGEAIGELEWIIGKASENRTTPPVGTWDRPNLWSKIDAEVLKAPPLNFLLAGLKLAKKYMIQHLCGVLDELVCERLCPSTFSDILAAAVQMDHVPLRMHCLRFAEESWPIHDMFEQGKFTVPEVTFELRSLWPQQVRKRTRYV